MTPDEFVALVQKLRDLGATQVSAEGYFAQLGPALSLRPVQVADKATTFTPMPPTAPIEDRARAARLKERKRELGEDL